MFVIQELIWVTIGVAIAVLRQIAFGSERSVAAVIAVGAIAGWCGGALTLLVSRQPWSTTALAAAAALAVAALSVQALAQKRSHWRRGRGRGA